MNQKKLRPAAALVLAFGAGVAATSLYNKVEQVPNVHEQFEVDMIAQDKAVIAAVLQKNKYDPKITLAYLAMANTSGLGARGIPSNATPAAAMPAIINNTLSSMLQDSRREIRQEQSKGEADFLLVPTARAVGQFRLVVEKTYNLDAGRSTPGILLAG